MSIRITLHTHPPCSLVMVYHLMPAPVLQHAALVEQPHSHDHHVAFSDDVFGLFYDHLYKIFTRHPGKLQPNAHSPSSQLPESDCVLEDHFLLFGFFSSFLTWVCFKASARFSLPPVPNVKISSTLDILHSAQSPPGNYPGLSLVVNDGKDPAKWQARQRRLHGDSCRWVLSPPEVNVFTAAEGVVHYLFHVTGARCSCSTDTGECALFRIICVLMYFCTVHRVRGRPASRL